MASALPSTVAREGGGTGEREKWSQRLWPALVGCVVASGLAVWSTKGVWGGRPPAGEDVMAHLVRLDFGISHVVARGRLDGWLPRFYLGYEEFLFNGPGLTWLVTGLRGATLGLLSNSGGLKAAGVVSFVATPPAVAFLARSLGLDRVVSGIAAVLSLLVSSVFGVGLAGLYAVGLVSHQLAAPLFFLALGALLRIPTHRRSRWVVVGGVSIAALVVTHLISVMILAVLYPLLAAGLLHRRPGLDGLRRLALTGALAFGLTGWWALPALAHRDLRGLVATWSTPPFGTRVDDIVDGRLLFRPYTAWLVFAGWAYALVRVHRRHPFALTLVITVPAYLALAHWAASHWPTNEFTLQLANRGLGYVGILALLPLAAALADGTRFMVQRLASRSWVAAPAVGVVMILCAALVVSPLGPQRRVVNQLPEPVGAMRDAAAQLARVVPAGARFAVQRDYPNEIYRTGVIQPATWLAEVSGRDSLNGFNLESSSTPGPDFEPDQLGKKSPEVSASALARLGVTHVVTTGNEQRDLLARSDRFTLVWEESPLVIFAVRARAGHPAPASLLATDHSATARLTRADPERLRIALDATASTVATVAVAWSPKWHGTLDGKGVILHRSTDGLIELDLPGGRSTLELSYRPDGWDRLGVAVSVATLIALVAWGVKRHRREGHHSTSRSFSRIA